MKSVKSIPTVTCRNYPIGFSDHSLGIEMASAATALGAALIEKHLTLDKNKIGMDNQMAINPDEMAQMIKNCKNINIALGSKERIVLQAELKQRSKMRRSVVYTKDILKPGKFLRQTTWTQSVPVQDCRPIKLMNL